MKVRSLVASVYVAVLPENEEVTVGVPPSMVFASTTGMAVYTLVESVAVKASPVLMVCSRSALTSTPSIVRLVRNTSSVWNIRKV